MKHNAEKPVRIGLVGCGAIAEMYHLPALQACGATQAGIVLAEPNAQRLNYLREKFTVADCVADYRDLEGRVDGIIVATPPALHFPIAQWGLERGLHVLCEKPLTESIFEARELVELAKTQGVKLAVNQTRRLFPTYQKIRELIAAGTLGEIQSIVYRDGMVYNWPAASASHFQAGAKGVWSDVGVHLLDSVCYWLNGKPDLTSSRNDSFGGPEAMATVCGQYQACDVEIKVSRLGRFQNGFQIVGTLGSIEAAAEDWDEFDVNFTNGTRRRHKCGSNRWQYTDFAKPLIENFAAVVAGTAEPIVSGESVLNTIDFLEEAYVDARPYRMRWNEHWERNNSSSGMDWTTNPSEARGLRVLVTGATGFLGGRVVEAMQLSNFATPVAALRDWSRATRIACRPLEFALCDILDPAQVDKTVASVDAIVHCAYGETRESIVDGTRNLLEAAQRHGIHQFVHLSSAEAYGSALTGVVTEDSLPQPTGNAYGESKLAAEELCRQYHARGLYPTILRPSLIYGPFGLSWSVDIAKRLQSGQWGLFDGFGEGTANLVYVDDLVQAIFRSLSDPKAGGETFNVNGPDRITWNQYFTMYNAALGLPPLPAISPAQSRLKTLVMDQVGRVTSFAKSRWEDKLMEVYERGGTASQWMKWLRNKLKSTPSAAELTNLYSRQAQYDDSKIKHKIGYAPEFDLQAGIDQTMDWLELHEVVANRSNHSHISSLPNKSHAIDAIGSH